MTTGERPLPHNLDAERSVLGAILIDNDTVSVADAIINGSDFYRHGHRLVYEQMQALWQRSQPIDLVTLMEELARAGHLDDAGGPAYIAALIDGVPRGTNVKYYAQIVSDKAQLRRTIIAANKIVGAAYDADSETVNNAVWDLNEVTSVRNATGSSPARVPESLVKLEEIRLRVRREAQRRLDAETCGADVEPDIATLRQRLARPRVETPFSIDGWQPAGGRVVLAAPFKAGKTTLVGCYVRSKVDGDPFLDAARVTVTSGSVAVLDFEMGPNQLDIWLAMQHIHNDDRVLVVPMRGMARSFNIIDPSTRSLWAKRLREAEVSDLVVDCLRPILDALGLDEHREAGKFLTALDALLKEAGIGDCLVVHHMGHSAERSRGDSRLRDWPDAEWTLVRAKDKNDSDDPAAPRFLRAFGRDVNQPEQQLEYDSMTRRLTLVGGTRRDLKTTAALDAVIEVLLKDAPLNGRAIKERLGDSGHARDRIDAALRFGVEHGRLHVEEGKQNAKLYRVVQVSGASGSVRQPQPDASSECPPPLREADTRTPESGAPQGVRSAPREPIRV